MDLDKIYKILNEVNDPEIGLSIVKLGMVGKIEEKDGTLEIEVKLTVPGCPLVKNIERDIITRFAEQGIKVNVNFSYMTNQELENAKKVVAEEKKSVPYTIERYTKSDDKKNIGKIIAVYSAKGGVGKSTIVSILAIVAKSLGKKVGILDCDISGPSIKSIFKINGYAEALDERKIIPYKKDGIEIVSLDLLSDAEAVVWRGPLVSGAIKQMYDDTLWGDLDVLFLDLPPGTSDAPITVFQSIPTDGLVIVTTPQDLSYITGKKTIFMAKEMKISILGIIENMSYVICPKCGEKISIGNQNRNYEEKLLIRLPFIQNIDDIIDKNEIDAFEQMKQVVKEILK